MRRAVRRAIRSSSIDGGAALAEFALILPLLLILTFGLIEVGIAFNRAQAVEAAAREGARLASISTSTQADVNDRIDAALTGIPLQNPVAVDPVASCRGREGEYVEVVVITQHQLNIPLVPLAPVELRGQAVFRCEA